MASETPIRIAALLPVEPEYAGRLLEGAISYAEQVPGVEILDLPYRRDKGVPPIADLPEFEGALVWLQAQDEWFSQLMARGTLVVNTSGDRSPEEVPTVVFQGSSVIKTAVEHLAMLGRSKAAYVGTEIAENRSLTWRIEQFSEACSRFDMTAVVHDLGQIEGIDDRIMRLTNPQEQALDQFIQSLGGPAVVWCDDDHIAHEICGSAHRCDLDVPLDLAVLGLYDTRIARVKRPSISSIPQPGQMIGRRAVQWIHEALRDDKPCSGLITLPSPEVVARDSTRCADQELSPCHMAMETIRKHACDGLTVNDLVNAANVSQRTFSRQFAELFGHTPGVAIRLVKTQKAKTYLVSTAYSVERISELCGFAEQGKFSNFFKRETGMTPSAWRQTGGNPD